jgi:pyruvate dehydrogenase E2 component (dihydrolipoamide acetyltransferase)
VSSVPVAEGDAGLAIARLLEKESHLPGGAAQRQRPPRDTPYAGPAVRQLARELGVTLTEVAGTGPKGRLLKEDLQAYVKKRLAEPPRASGGLALPDVPAIDFSAFGPIEMQALTGIQKATVTNMSRSWLNVPHVTQFDYADVTDLEAFRESLKAEMDKRGNKLTPLPFLLMACARALKEHPRFNASLAPGGTQIVLKKYVHIGIAVDTPQGLLVPVIRDVDRKTVWELAAEARDLAERARARKLSPAEMQGGCFTISSLGTIGGEGFTPIVNTPEVSILGVSRMAVRPMWDGKAFQPRKTLPLSLSYDHRVINGADAGAFLTWLVGVLADLRKLVL